MQQQFGFRLLACWDHPPPPLPACSSRLQAPGTWPQPDLGRLAIMPSLSFHCLPCRARWLWLSNKDTSCRPAVGNNDFNTAVTSIAGYLPSYQINNSFCIPYDFSTRRVSICLTFSQRVAPFQPIVIVSALLLSLPEAPTPFMLIWLLALPCYDTT